VAPKGDVGHVRRLNHTHDQDRPMERTAFHSIFDITHAFNQRQADNITLHDHDTSTSSISSVAATTLSLSRMRSYLILLLFASYFLGVSPTVQRGPHLRGAGNELLKFNTRGCHFPSGNDACWRHLCWIFSGDPYAYGYRAEQRNCDSDDEMNDGNDDEMTTSISWKIKLSLQYQLRTEGEMQMSIWNPLLTRRNERRHQT